MRRRVESENRNRQDWEKKLSCNKYAELSIAAQLQRDEKINEFNRSRVRDRHDSD